MAAQHVKGLAQLHRMYDRLPEMMARDIVPPAIAAGMEVIKTEAQSNIRSQSGLLADGLAIDVESKGFKVTCSLRATGPHSHVAHLVEFGTKPHFISVSDEDRGINRRTGKPLSMRTVNRRALQIGANFIGPIVHHPGARPQPFMLPALDSRGQDALATAAAEINRRLERLPR